MQRFRVYLKDYYRDLPHSPYNEAVANFSVEARST